MCDIFPEFNSCCFLISLRVAMLFISVFAIMTGCVCLSIMKQKTVVSVQHIHNITKIKDPTDALERLELFAPTGICLMSFIFIFTGLLLLFGTLTDEEGLIQVFVWGMFLAIILGFILIVSVTMECMFKDICLLSDLDWLSAAATIIILVAYLFLWVYFISVVNSYVIGVAH